MPAIPRDEPWLRPWLGRLGQPGSLLLELGCGPGQDAATLDGAGFEVVALDRSDSMLRLARTRARRVHLLRADISAPLPFRDETFDAAIASLSLHYLTWAQTRAAFAEIRRVLRPGQPLLFRVNATDDIHHGAGSGVEVERNLYRAEPGGHASLKRFFDEQSVRQAVEGYFRVEDLRHVTIHRYQHPKQAWQCLAVAESV